MGSCSPSLTCRPATRSGRRYRTPAASTPTGCRQASSTCWATTGRTHATAGTGDRSRARASSARWCWCGGTTTAPTSAGSDPGLRPRRLRGQFQWRGAGSAQASRATPVTPWMRDLGSAPHGTRLCTWLRSPGGSAQLLDADQVACGIAEGAVANPVRLLDRLLNDLGVAACSRSKVPSRSLVARSGMFGSSQAANRHRPALPAPSGKPGAP